MDIGPFRRVIQVTLRPVPQRATFEAEDVEAVDEER